MLDKLDEYADKMPQPEFIELANNLINSFFVAEEVPFITISWQWVLEKTVEALIAKNASEIIKLLFLVDYAQLNKNALNDVCSIVRQPIDENSLREIQVEIDGFKELIREYLLYPQNNRTKLDYIINKSSFVLDKLKNLGIVGIGAFMLASGLRLALLQERAKLDTTKWNNIKEQAIDYSKYAKIVTPKLIKLTVGSIDKECKCSKRKSGHEGEKITEYECRYFDGKDIHVFRGLSPNVVIECNKHRLQMFYDVADKVNKVAVNPVRLASRKWLELAASI